MTTATASASEGRNSGQAQEHGQPSAQEFLTELARLYPDLRRRAERLTGSATAADDLLHDAMERGLKNRQRFHTGGSPERWMKTILLRVFIDGRRRSHRHPHILCAQPDEFPSETPPPGHQGEEWERYTDTDLRDAIAQLPPSFRAVYQAYALEHRTHADIASALNLPPGTVGTRIMRARTKLRRILIENAARPRTEPPTLRLLTGGGAVKGATRPRTRTRTPRNLTPTPTSASAKCATG